MAITAWSAKVCSSAICFSLNGRTSVRRIIIAPTAAPSRNSGTASDVRIPRRSSVRQAFGKVQLTLCHHVLNVDNFSIENGAATDRATA